MRKALLITIVTLCAALSVAAQTTVSWYRVTPEGEEFSVLMPDYPFRIRRELPLAENMKITPPTFEIGYGGALYSVISIEKAKLPPARNTAEGFVKSFSYAVSHGGSGAGSSLTFERDVSAGGKTAKQFALKSGEYQGTARIYETAARYYVLMTVGAQAGDLAADNFFNSFSLSPQDESRSSNRVPYDEKAPGRGSAQVPKSIWPVAGSQIVIGGASPANKLAGASNDAGLPKVAGGILTGRALAIPQPEYPPIAMAARAQGAVVVQVTVDEEGYVIATHAVSGNPLLQAAAERAARQARFAPTTLDGKPVKVTGTLTYNFALK